MSKRHLSCFAREAIGAVFCLATLLSLKLGRPALTAHADLGTDVVFVGTDRMETNSVAWGDYDGDGDLDLAVGNKVQVNQVYENDVGVFRLDPSNGFGWVSSDEKSTESVAWGDWDGDGDLDLAVGNWLQVNQVYENDGGTLRLNPSNGFGWESPDERNTTSVAWGDYDGDGDLDLAIGNLGEANQVYENDRGTLRLNPSNGFGWESLEGDQTVSVAWGDWDGDGDLDLAVGNGRANHQVDQVYENDGQTLRLDPSNGFGWESTGDEKYTASVAWGDWDGDGDLDLAADDRIYENDEGTLVLDPVNGLGWDGGEGATSVAWGDWDGDGDLDLAVGGGGSQVYENDGGTLILDPSNGFGWESDEIPTESVAWGDYDGDGDLDLAVGNDDVTLPGEVNRVYVNHSGMLRLGSGFGWESTGDEKYTESVAWGDWDGDGDLDLAVGNGHFAGYGDQVNQVYENDGGTLKLDPGNGFGWESTGDESCTESVAWGDYDDDGDLDLAVGNSGYPAEANQIYENDGRTLKLDPSNGFGWESPETEQTKSVAWGDWDGDGDLDLAADARVYENDEGTLVLDPDNGLGWDGGGGGTSVAWGDWDSDGDLDLAIGNWANGGEVNQVYESDGGTLKLDPSNGFGWESTGDEKHTASVAWGDYDGDGDLDLAIGNWANAGEVNQVYENDGGTLKLDPSNGLGWESTGDTVDTVSVAWGDWDGDGDLDLAFGNSCCPRTNQVYENDEGTLKLGNGFGWESTGEGHPSSVAWGDWDGDGDLDLAVGNWDEVSQIFENPLVGGARLANNPPYVTLFCPGAAATADFFYTPHIIQTANISITYILFDPEGDIASKILPEFSPSGGGQWFPATPGPSGDGITKLAASPNGTPHTFVWNVEADLVKSDSVVFRIRVQPSFGPIQWSSLDAKSPSFRVTAPWYIKVVDEDGNPVVGTTVYANGQPITETVTGSSVTNQAGLLNPGPLAPGTSLAALAPQAEQPTVRTAHDGWAYRTYLNTEPFTVSGPGEQRLVARRDNPLVLFNLIVSIEWDATVTYTQQISRAVRHASDYLYDLTDGQMAFGQVTIYDNAEHWGDADIQVSAKNTVRPHAYVGGITSSDKSHVIRVGRFWDGNSGNQGPWDQRDGYRTLAHEFGHYALYLYDEYFAYLFDLDGNLLGEVPAYCTGPENHNPATDATNASVMDYQYTTSELSAYGVPGMWSDLCEQTAQWQLNGESTWETLAGRYADFLSPPRWHLTTPADRDSVLAGPDSLRPDLPDWPLIKVHQGQSPSIRKVTVYGPQGPHWSAQVTLYTNQRGHLVAIDQGFTNRLGQIDVYGAQPGDTLRAASFDGALSGSVSVADALTYTLVMVPSTSLQALALPNLNPHLILRPSSDGDTLYLRMAGLGSGGTLVAIVTQSGGNDSQATALAYSSAEEAYVGAVTFAPKVRQGTGTVQVIGVGVGSRGISLNSTYALEAISRSRVTDLHSADGNLHVHLITGTVPLDAYAVLSPLNAAPIQPPAGLQIVGNVYDVKLSGLPDVAPADRPYVLKLHYDPEILKGDFIGPKTLRIYRWENDPTDQARWVALGGSRLEGDNSVSIATDRFGVCALMGFRVAESIYLPLIMTDW